MKFKEDINFLNIEKSSKIISIIGCGRWGSFIGWYLDSVGHKVSIYGRSSSVNMNRLMDTWKNDYLELNESIHLTNDISSIQESEIIIISTGAQTLSKVAEQLSDFKIRNKIIVLCMKGIEISSGRRLTQIVDDTLHHSNKVAVWLGPGHPQEFHRGIPNCMVIDSNESSVYGLCHLGDYEATVFSEYSQNRAFGENIVNRKTYDKLAEGYFTVKALRNLGENYGIELPICEAVYQILYCQSEPSSILEMLFQRNLKNEF